MSNFASGKKAKAISDRSGMAFPYNEMLKEWNGSFVHMSEFEAKHPQIEMKVHKPDNKHYKTQDQTEKKLLFQTYYHLTHLKQQALGLV